MSTRIRNKACVKLFFSIWLVYALYAAPAGGVLPNRYLDLTFSIVNEGRLIIDTYHDNTIDKAYYQGHYYTVALPGPAFMAIPAYLVFKPIYAWLPEPVKAMASGMQSLKKETLGATSFYGKVDNVEFFSSQMFITLTLQATISALGSVFLFLVLAQLGFDLARAVLVTFAYAFGTIVFFFSTVFFEQVLTASLLIGAFYFLLRALDETVIPQRRAMYSLIGGLLGGMGLTVEYTAVLAGGVFGLWLIVQRKWQLVFFFALGYVLPVMGLMAYNASIFGTPFTTAYRYIDAAQYKNHAEGFFGITYPHIERFIGLVLSGDRGLLVFAPIAALGLLGLIVQAAKPTRHRAVAILGLAVTALFLLFYSSITDWRGGASFGPRYLIPILPFLMLGVAMAFDILPAILIYFVIAWSVAINWLGAQFGFADSIFEHVENVIQQGPTLPVLGAILSHSTRHDSALYSLAANYHVAITLGSSALLVLFLFWWWRELWRQPTGGK